MRWKKARIAVTDRFGNILLTRMYNNPCCTTHAELMAIKAGYKIIGGIGTIYNDNTGAILKFKEMLSKKKALLVNVRYNWLGKSIVDRASKIRDRHKKLRAYKVKWEKYHIKSNKTRKSIIREWKRIDKEKHAEENFRKKRKLKHMKFLFNSPYAGYFCIGCNNPVSLFDLELKRCNTCLRHIQKSSLIFR